MYTVGKRGGLMKQLSAVLTSGKNKSTIEVREHNFMLI